MEDKLLGLYNDFKNAGLFKDTKDYGTFRQRMQGQGYQAQIYKVAKQNGADVGQFWQFQRNFGLGRWAGGSRQSIQSSKPLTTAQRAGQVAQEYKKNLQQKSGAYKEGANYIQANGYEGESLGDLIGDAWEGVKSVGRKIGNSVASHIGDYGGSVRAAARQVNPNYGAKPSKETHQVLKSWDVLTKKDRQLTPAERAVASNMRTRMQRAQEQSARQEQQRATPISRSRITPTAKNFNETMQQLSTPEAKQARIKQQHEDDLNQMAYQGVGQNLGKDIFAMTDKAIDLAEQSSKEFFKGAEDALGFSRQYDPRIQKSIADAADMRKSTETIQRGLQIGLADKVQEYFSRPEIQKNVMDTAEKMNISLEEAVQKYYMPNLMQYAKDAVEQRQLEKVLPQSYFDYLGKNLSNNIVGMIVSNGMYSKEERQRRQRALAISEGFEEAPQMVGHETKYYKAGILARASGTGLNMLADSPFFGVGGTAADMAVNAGSRILARGLEKVGLKTIGKVLTPREMAFKAANMSTAQKIASGLTTGTAKSALNLSGYSFITGGLQQISTGEDSSPAAVALAAIESGWHGAKTGAMFGFSGSVMHPWVSKYGITGLERNAEQRFIHGAQKVGATAAGLGVEAGTMMVADHLQDDKEMSFAQWLEDGVTVMAFKLGEPRNYKHVGSILHGLTHNTSKTPITLTKDEKNELINSTSGKNLMDAFLDVSKASRKSPMYKSVYKDFMADPEVSRSTKEKVNAALGMPSQNYKISQRSVNDVKNKQILEYASDGTLLTRTSYKNAEERRDILYRQKTDRDNMHVLNLVGIAKLRGRQLIDDDGKVSRIAADFLQGKGYDINKEATDPKNAEMIANLQNPKHELYLDWIKYADEHNQFTGIDASINEILKKHPLKRTDEEVAKLKEYSQNLEAQLFPADKLHPEESKNQGRSIAEDNNLGTEQPNGDTVKQELNGLRQAEAEMDVLIRDNDVFGQNFKKLQEQGLTNPQIYDWMVQQGGLTVEQLAPFAQYMHANERVQGMQEATREAIDENVNTRADQWSFHGTINGNEMNGEQVLYVTDNEGRTLIVGSGEVAFDPITGRAKEDVGDMLVCLDANTRETVYLKAEDVTLSKTQNVEDFKSEDRLRLQMINSQPYNEAAQEQAILDAAKPQQEQSAAAETRQEYTEVPQQSYTLSDKKAGNGEQFYQDESGNIDLANVPDEVFDSIGYTKAPFRLTPSMIQHMLARHNKELKFKDENEAIHFVRDVMTNFDHVRLGNDGALVFSIENGRNRTGKRAITILINSDNGEFYGLKTSGYEAIKGLEKRPLLWERGAKNESSSTDAASASVTTSKSPISGEQSGSASHQNIGLDGKDTNNSSNDNENKTTLTFSDGSPVPVDANGEPDFLKMTPEQGAEVYKMLFEEDAPMQIDSDIKTLEKDLEKVQNAKYEGASVMERAEARKKAKEAVAVAEAQVEKAKAIKKAMTAKKVSETVGKTEQTEGAHEAGSVAAQKFVNAPRLVGNKRTRMLPDGETKIKGHYEIVPAESLTPSHDVNNDYKKSEGFPTDAEGRTVNDRDYEHDKAAQQNTDQIARKYNGMAIEQVPVVSDEGIVYDGNGRTMAGQKAAKEGTDAEYINDLLENAENFGFTKEQIEQSGIEHPRLVLVTDERLPYDAATFAKFNRNEKKTQSNTEQAVAKAKTLTSDEVGAIVAEIEGNGSLDAFFNNSKAINDLVKTLVDKGIIGQNEVAQMMDSPERLSAQGREYVKNLLLGSIFKPETIRMLGIDSTVKNKAINAIRSVMDNMKLGDYSLRDEIDQAIPLLYEARQGGNKVDTLLRTPDMFGEDAAKRYSSISQMMALALEGKVSDFRDLLDEYNRIAAARNTGEGSIFEAAPTKEELVKEFLDFKKWQDYGTGHSEIEGSNDVSSVEKPQQEASGGNEPAEAGTEPERPRVEEPDDLVNKELESRIKVTDEETETPSKNGPIMKQKILIDGDKEVIKVDEPNEKGEYTGSYYEYDGKKFGDLNEVVEYVDGKVKEKPLPLLPKEENPDPTFDPIAAAAQEFKKEHPLTEDEIKKADVDDLSKDIALDYLNGEVTDDLHRAIYESIFAKTRGQKTEPKVETPKAEPSADPMEGIKNAAEGFEKEKKAKTEKKPQQTADDAAVAASNKKVNDLWDMLKNAGKDEISASFVGLNSRQLEVLPKLVSAMAENAYLRIKRGMHNLEDVVKEMRKEFAPAAKLFKKEDVDAIYEQMMNIRYRDGEQRMSLKEWADYYEKTSPKHQENLVGDSKTAEERKMAEKKFIDVVNLQLGFKHKFNGIVELRKIAERVGLKDIKDTDLQELAETAIVKRARGIASSESTNDAVKFERIKTLYENQPSLNQRDSERVMKQQYSTPAPYAFLADMYVKGKGKVIDSALEPSAGNGMLTIGLPMDKVHVNDIDAQRLANLRRQGFKNVTSQDGTQPFKVKPVDIVITNPPFGSATTRDYDGYKISSLEGQMAINALESMKGDGRAAIIIGGNTEYAKNGSLKPKDKAFLGYLYSHYNVEDVINVDGSLYAKQGTSYPTRIILINGRRNYDPEHKVFPPVEKEARAEAVKDYDELYKRIEDDILRSTEQPVDIRRKEKREGDKPSGRENVSDSTEENGGRGRLGTTTVHDGTSENSEPTELDPSTRPVGQSEDADGRPVEAIGNGDSNTDGRGGQTSVPKSGPADGGSERGGNEPSGGNEPLRNGNGENGREPGVRHGSGHIQQPLENTPKEEKKQSLTTEKVKYQPHSAAYSIGAVVPARQKEALDNVLNKLGDADQYLVDNLGYNDKEDLYAHLAAEQIDAVALGLKQMEKGNGFIIGDQTGIGKGRQAAAIIRYAVKQGRIPISFTQKANLFSDTYRDLNDIGSPELRPFILASSNEGNIKVNYDEEVKGLDGQTTTVRKQKVVYKVPSKTETERVLKYIAENGKLPEGYDYILTTYSQIRNGMEEFKGGKWKAKKKVTATDRNGQMKRDAIKRIAENSVFILDESHDAAGEGSGSAFIQDVLPKVKGVTFLSATYAKTPDAMKLYALKTDLGSKNKEEGEKGDASWKVLNAIKKGGAVFQEIMSQALTKSGQMIRRERDMTGVTIDWNPLTENEVEIQGQRDKFDNIFGIFNDILNFQRTYVDAKLGQMSDDLAFIQGSVDHTPGTKDMGIGNVTFASKAYNVVQQALFSIKAEKVADYAIEAIKNGEKPVIAVNNTMGSMIDEYPMGVEMDMPDLNSTLMKGLEGILRYTEKNDMGDQVNSTLRVEELGEEAVARYNEIKQKIASVSSGLSISPIDVIKHRLEEAGYKVGELTGRNTEMVYTEDGKVIRKNRTDKNKNALADRFNNGDLDALILNRSAAAGISLHASSKYKDQRQRTMIFAQMQGNINDEVQIRGRIDRTGQVRRGKYVYLVSAIPAEQRLMMMFKNKLKSLDANTTSSQKSKFNEVDVQDFTNKYGDEIVLQYMAQHPEYYNKLADPLGWGFMEYARDGLSIGELKSGMKPNITSPAYEVMKRLTLLPVKEQEVVLKDISDSYSQKIKQLNDMGMNDLEMTDMPLEAKTLKREVWKEGSDPNGDNAFADNTYIETVEMNVLRKPMKAEEVEEAQKKMLDGKDYDTWRKDKVAEIRAAQQAKIEDTKAKMAAQAEKKVAKVEESTRLALEKENAKIQKKLDKGEELKPGEHILTEEEIKTRVDTAVDDVKRRLSKKLSDAIENVNVKYDMFVNPLFIFDPNRTISVPNDWYMEEASTSLYPEFGRVIGFKYDKNYNLGSSSIVIATTDSRKRVEIPLNRPAVFERIQSDSERFSKECKVVNMDAWDRMIPKKDRTTGRIITGNMLEALSDNSAIGHLISYTTDDGKVKQGILVPDSVSTAEITGNMPIAKAYNWLTKKSGGTELVSTDGTLRLTKNFDSMYTLFVSASRKDGGKYYLNQDLLNLVHGHNFQSKGNKFWATFDSKDLHDVLYVLNKMDVEVKTPNDYEESKTHFREDRGLQYSKTDTKDVKKGRIIPEDVDKNVSSQIEKKFDDRVDELTKDLSDEDKAEFNRHLDYYTSVFSRYKASEITYTLNGLENDVRFWGRSLGNGEKASRTHLVRLKTAELRAAETAARREMDYREVRAKALADGYGLRRGAKASFADISRLFEATNQAKEEGARRLFEKAFDIAKRLGVEFGGMDEGDERGNVGEATPERNINLFIDTLSRTYTNPKEAAHTILHELIHQATMGAIHLVKDGKAEGMLTPKQIEAVKTVIDIYNKAKADGRIVWEEGKRRNYGGKDEYEFTAEMAGGKQRKILDLSLGERIMNAVNELRNRGDNSLWQAVKNAWHKLFEISDKSKMDKALNDIMDDFNEKIDDIAMNDIEENGYAYRVTDKDELDRLNKEKTFRMYSGMQEVDGKLYSPMAAIIDGKRTDATEIGAWMGADERPDLVKNGKFQLVKTDKNPGAGEGPVPAAYNPYMHTSTSVMNDQFSGAYARGNIKVVEWEIPESEKTSGYHAEGAKNSVGLVPWTSGTVNSLLPKDRQRSVMLSRWRKAVRILPDEEVAEKIADQLRGTGLAIPWNVVTPSQLRELVKLGVPITTVEQGRQNPETKEKFLKQMAELEQEFPQAKFVNVKMTKDAYKEWGKNGGTKFRTDNGESNYPASSVENHIEKVAQKTGAKVKMVSSVDEITNKAAKAAIEEGRKITGWYDEKTGEVHLYMPNIHDRYTAEKTIWHEVVGHKGMRELFGDERFDKFLREVWYDLDKPENAALKKLVDEERKFNPLNIYDAIEEGIARLAEDGKGEPGFWNGIKNKVSDFLHEIGYRIAPNTKDVKYLLWLSKNLQKNPNDPYWKLRAEAVKYRLDHERMPAVVAHDGMFYGNDGKVRSMDNLTKAEWNEATDGEIHFRTTPSAGTALDRYHRSLDEHGYMFTESYMDNMLSLKKLMNAIVPDKKIEDIASSENPYMLQNTMQGAMSDAAQMFKRNVMKPLDKAMADVLDAFDGKKDDEKIRNFNLYMITKHGLERNREFFVRDFLRNMRMDEQKKQDANFLENSYYSDKEYLDNELKAGNIDLKEYYRQLDESIRNHFDADFEAGEHDYSGMHAIQEVTKSSDPYNDAEAIQSVMDSEAKMESIKKGAVKDYWDKVKAATQYSIDSDYKNGIISKELHGHVSNMFNWYVPLRKYDEATAEDTYGYITEQGDPKSYIGSTIMRARGHKYLSETNVLAQIGAMGNRAIKNGGMNAIRQAFARFARNNSGNNLITETSVWYEKDPVVNIVYERYPDIPEDATADEINQIVSDFNKDMKMKESQGMAYKVYRRDKIGYKFQRAENKSQHIVDVKIAGRTHTFIINGNPRAAQALNGLLENSGAKGIMKPLSSISRMMAQLCTSYNPEFVMRNIMRDAEFASSNVTSKEGARYGALWAKYYAQLGLYKGASNISFKDLSGTTGLGLFAKYRNGTLDMSDKVQRYFKEFMENGGETGWVQIKNMQDWTKEYKKDVKGERSKIDKGGAVLRDFFFGNLANINEVAENIARFATYCASRDSNRSIIRSVYDAKEVSTNFNRHGSGDAIKSFKNGEMTGGKAAARWTYGFTASYLRHCSMFFNAGIQSTNLLVKNLKNHPVGTSINMLAIPFALGALAALGNNVLIASEDEKDRKGVKDPYGELPDYVRRNNLCIYKGGGEFVTIPLAIELRAFYGLGDLAAGLTFSPNVSGQKNPALDAVGCMSQLVPVMDYLGNSSAGKEPLNETIKAISPSALSPFVEWELNTDWKGAPIERRGDWNENSPAWQRAYRGVPDGYMAVNKWVNAQTNDVAKGNEDMLGNSFLDMVTNPSMLNHYIGGIGGGAATFTERAIGVIKHGKDTETKDIPFLRSLLYTPSEQSSLQRTKSKWYNYKDEMEKTMANVDRLKSKNVPIDKRITNIGEYFHFQNSKEAAKVRVIELAEKQMKRWKKLRDKSSDTESINFANQNIDRIMMDAVDELDRLE